MSALLPAKIVLATHNQGKIREIQQCLDHLPVDFLPITDYSNTEPEETGLSFVENAIIKARIACQYSQLPALADDSGLMVDALDGAPGVYSARYGGDHVSGEVHSAKLLSALSGVPSAKRTARFMCVLVFMRFAKDPAPQIFEGSLDGLILDQPKGEGGFGYDPVFYIPELSCTAAELDIGKKAKISHRGLALDHFLEYLTSFAEKNIK